MVAVLLLTVSFKLHVSFRLEEENIRYRRDMMQQRQRTISITTDDSRAQVVGSMKMPELGALSLRSLLFLFNALLSPLFILQLETARVEIRNLKAELEKTRKKR